MKNQSKVDEIRDVTDKRGGLCVKLIGRLET
jgi:hypothetical protein